MDSIQTNTQSPGQKGRRHRDNILTIQANITGQMRDINAALETLQQQKPTLDLQAMFMSVHQLDSNFRALLDEAKEAAGVDGFDVPPPPRLIDVTSSLNEPKPPDPFTHIHISDTAQPAGAGGRPARSPSTDLTPATEATQAQQNNIAVNPGSAPA